MPVFTMSMGNCWAAKSGWMFDFVLATHGEPIEMLHEDKVHSEEWEKDGWTFMNSYMLQPNPNN